MYAPLVTRHNLFTMALHYLVIALVIQGSCTYANVTDSQEFVDNVELVNNNTDVHDDVDKDFQAEQKDWIDFFLLNDAHLYPSSSVAMMNQVTNSDKSAEEQIEEIKEIAAKITLAIQSEMANLLTYALNSCDQKSEGVEGDINTVREKRSAETPMASTQLVTRLLKHIKSNNEFQNIAIEKMMTAQEIAEKYGIEFSPDTEVLSDLAFAANQQAKEMNSLLQDSIEMKNASRKVEYVPLDTSPVNAAQHNEAYYVHAVQNPEPKPQSQMPHTAPAVNHHHHADSYPSYNYYYNYPYETQIPSPVQNYYSPPVSKRPNFYDTVSYAPQDYTYCSMEPMISASTIVMPFEELLEPEPELVGEEFEETVSSKVYVDRGNEPGSATVNHVMTYTVAEKSHFRTPEIESLPQQMQYCFFLM